MAWDYSEKEIAFIKKNKGRLTYKEMAEELGRSERAVRVKVFRLANEKKKVGKFSKFTDYERRYITQYYGNQKTYEIAHLLGRTENSVRIAYHRFKQDEEQFERDIEADSLERKTPKNPKRNDKKCRAYSEDELAMIVQFTNRGDGKDLAHALGRSYTSIRQVRSRLKKDKGRYEQLKKRDVMEVARWYNLL